MYMMHEEKNKRKKISRKLIKYESKYIQINKQKKNK